VHSTLDDTHPANATAASHARAHTGGASALLAPLGWSGRVLPVGFDGLEKALATMLLLSAAYRMVVVRAGAA
jgi:hypothetical protein